ncbi:GNAT family N-acetyltransferase [Pantanalinema rosaneae CENA516]|uniref:GNAT family N-acetyltransferase n=1 Tax=Pantanalinema rosaneae TaxID=1620701 RepID=UPI003D6E1B7F
MAELGRTLEVVIKAELDTQERLEIQTIFDRIYDQYGGSGYLGYLVHSVSEETQFVLLKQQGRVVATSALYTLSDRAGEVFFVAVDPDRRGEGFGWAVNQAVADYAQSKGLEMLYTGPLINFCEWQGSDWRLNLGNLVTTQRQGYTLTGFALGQYVDFMYKLPGLPQNWTQNLSGAFMAKLLVKSEADQQKFQQECLIAHNQLVASLQSALHEQIHQNGEIDLEVVDIDGAVDAEGRPTIVISQLGYSRNIEDLLATLHTEQPFVPCGYYPSYRRFGETYYVGLHIRQLVALKPENIWGLDRRALNAVISEGDRRLLDLIERQMTLTFGDQVKLASEGN